YPRSPRGERPLRLPNLRRHNDFYPRSPRGERQPHQRPRHRPDPISIHAPREGSDAPLSVSARESSAFLSTLPARGATPRPPSMRRPSAFLSTLPARGATASFRHFFTASRIFLSTLPARGAT